MFYTYILYSIHFDKFYIGQTHNITARLERHNRGLVQSTRAYRPWTLEVAIEKPSRSEAVMLETKLKNLSKDRLRKFIEKYG